MATGPDRGSVALPGMSGRHCRSVAPWRGGLVALVAAFAMAACGGDEASSTGPAGVNTAKPSGSASPAAEETGLWPEDFVLTEGTATAGFTGAPEEPSDDSEDTEEDAVLDADFAECLGLSTEEFDAESEASADGLTFTGADGFSTIESSAEIVTGEQAERDRGLLTHPRTRDCMTELFEAQADRSEEEGVVVEAAPVEALPPPAGASAHYRLTMRASGPGGTVEVTTDMLFFIEGQVEVLVSYMNLGEAPQQDRLQQIADQIAEKLRDQQPRSIAGRPREGGPVIRALGPLNL
ncbi:hypothetical protein CC117_09575 [Parafrankia colletiae]|uniref:DUF5642 domain-containing protein n=2 Tax=Parafrankia colletiae TaxID=573497 RepID=A0A1S1RG03_9ACTN|nr:hypothetical protein CC117_09575 [Parafrankia colletiae]